MKNHPYFTKYLITDTGQVFSLFKERFITPHKNEFGYLVVNVVDPEDGKSKKRKIHRLVAETYLDNPENKREVNHIDSNKTNNHVSNLEWATSKENKDHAWANKLYSSFGEQHPDSVLTELEVHEICRLMEEGARNIDLCKAYGVHKDTISHIRSGDNWKHITCLYNLKKKRVERKSPELVIKIAELLEIGWDCSKISEHLMLNVKEVYRIKNRQTHSSLTKDYSF